MVPKKGLKLVNVLLLSGLLLGIFFFLVFYNGGNITGAVISVGDGCSEQVVCTNETVSVCAPEIVQECSGECTSEMKEVCTDECAPQCSSEEVNGEMRETCITVCNPVCVMQEVKDCSGQVCQNVTQQKCEDEVKQTCATETVCGNSSASAPIQGAVVAENSSENSGLGMEGGLDIFDAPVISNVVLNSTNLSLNHTDVNLTAYFNFTTPGVKGIVGNWYRNNTAKIFVSMPFEGVNDTATANAWDYSGYGRNASENGPAGNLPVWNRTGGYDGNGSYLFNSTGYLASSFPNMPAAGGDISIVAWIKQDTLTGNQDVVTKGSSGVCFGWGMTITTGQLRAVNNAAYNLLGSVNTIANTWNHVAIVYNSSGAFGYINGTFVGNNSAATVTNCAGNNNLTIGAEGQNAREFKGYIDDLTIWNMSLTAEQVKSLFNNRTDIVAGHTYRSENWSVRVTPNNGTGDGAEVMSNNVSILNALPTQGTPILNTTNISSNNTNVNLTAYNISTVDIDLDPVKNIYNWQVNGSSITLLNMPFEGINGTTGSLGKAWDYSGYARNASENGNALWNATGGYDGKGAYFFDGTDDFLQGSLPTNTAGANITVTAWIKPDAVNDRLIFVKGNAGVCFGYGLNIRTVGLTAYNNNGAVTLGGGIEIDAWNFLAVVYNATGAFGYINGTFVGNSSAGTTSTCAATNYTIGVRAGDNTADYQGHIDDLMVWNRSLTAEQILALYNNRTDLIVGNETIKHQNWSVQITPNDGYADGDTLASNVVDILNAPPTHAAPILNTTNVSLNASFLQNLTLYPQNATDTDGDVNIKNITNWFVNGTSVTLLNLPFEGGSQSGREVVNGTRDYTGININVTVFSEFNSSGGYDGRGAYVFNGSRYITTRVPATVGKENVTITAWVNPTATNDRMVIQTIGANAACFGYGMMVRNTGLAAATGSVTATLGSGGGGVEANAWNFLTIVFNSSGAFGYINGTYVGNSSAATVTSCANINTTIGQSTPGANPFLGHIDEVMVWNRSLTQAEISALYNNRTDMIVSEELRKNQVWYAQVTPNDGQSDGDTLTSNNVTILDRTVPTVNINNPANGSNFSAVTYNFNATVTDTESSISTVLFMFNTNTTPFNITASNSSGVWNAAVNLATLTDRIHAVTVFANDTENNVNSSQSINFTVDKTPPNVTLNFLNNFVNGSNFSIRSNNQTFNASIFDALLLVDNVYFWFDNGTGQDFNATATNQSGQWIVSYNVSALAEQRQGVRIMANDTVSNLNNSQVINFTVDRTSPNVTLNFLNNFANSSNFSIRSSNQTFNASIFDALTEVSNMYFWFDNSSGNDFNVTALNISGVWTVNYNVSVLTEGKQSARVMANDTVGNLNDTFFINFTVDLNAPNITINSLNNPGNASNFSMSTNNVTFNVSVFDTITDVSNVYFWFDNGTGQDFNVTGLNQSGQWTVSYNVSGLAEERQGLRIVANDTVSNVNNSVTVNFTVDRTNPVVTVSCNPSSSSVGENVVCDCSATDTLSQVRTATFSGGATSLSFNVGSAGDHTTPGCIATDFSGNSISGVGSFTIVGSSGSSSGGSGGGSSSGSSGQFKKSTWASLNPGETATVQVDDAEIGVQEVEVTVNDLVNGIWIEVRKDNVPEEVQLKFKRKIYKDLEIIAGPTLPYDKVEDAKVKFIVEKDWLKQNQMPKENIALFRYVKLYLPQEVNAWAELPTDVTKEEDSVVEYSAQTPGFSYFLIGERIPEGKPTEEVTQGKVTEKYLPEEAQPSGGALVGGAYYSDRLIKAATANLDLIISGTVIVFVIIMIGLLFGHTHKKKRLQEAARKK